MARSSALALRRSKAQTPLVPDAWEEALSRLRLLRSFPSVPSILRSGADAGIKTIAHMYAPDNSSSIHDNPIIFTNIVLDEFAKNRYFGPFTESEVIHELGPFQTSPLSLVPKPHSNPPKFRQVNNLSHPRIPRTYPSYTLTSINHSIDADNYPCTWGTFAAVSLLISRLPPGSQGAVRDVSEAYRCIPLAPNQWPGTVVRLSDTLFAINVALLFGLTSSGGIWGLIADALCAILRASGIGPLSKWVSPR